jgi:adenylate kinase family enzyme
MKNSGRYPISFSVDKSAMTNTGFNIEPERVKGLPEGESVDFQLIFNAKNPDPSVGFNFSINILGGPQIIIKVKVNITLPEIIFLTSQTIDFGVVLTGFRHSISTEIQNTSDVPCDWKYAEDKETKKSSKKPRKNLSSANFEMIPSFGTLAPLETIKLIVRFTPTENNVYDCVLPIKVIMSQKTYGLRLLGKGIMPMIKFSPIDINPGSVTPFSEATECKFFIENLINYPVEIYSVENDLQHTEEEEIIRSLEGFRDGIIYLPPRKIGSNLADYLSKHKLIPFKINDVSDEVNASLASSGVGDILELKTPRSNGSGPNEFDQEASNSISVILHGPPLSGKTCQAKRIAQNMDKLYIHIDDLIEANKKKAENSHPNSGDTEKIINEGEDQIEDGSTVDENLICDILKMKLNKAESRKGVVIDGLESKYCNIVTLTRRVVKLFAERNRKVIFFHFSLEINNIRERETLQIKKKEKKDLDSLFIKELSEDDYDLLPETDRCSYDKAIQAYKRKVKEIQEMRRVRRNFEQGILQNRAGERKVDDEKSKVKKARAPIVQKAEKVEKPNKTDAKQNKTGKGAGKNGAEKVDKPEKGDKGEKQGEKDEEAPKLVLEETFFNEILLKRTEGYLSSIEATLSSAKESEKHGKMPQIVEKKSKQQNKGLFENPNDEIEENIIEIHEINVNLLNDESLFKTLQAMIPVPVFEEEVQVISVNENILEQIIVFPTNRPRTMPSKIFLLAPANEQDDDKALTEMHPTVITPPAALPATTPKAETKTDYKDSKKNKAVVKVAEEKPIEMEEEPEKEAVAKYRWVLVTIA